MTVTLLALVTSMAWGHPVLAQQTGADGELAFQTRPLLEFSTGLTRMATRWSGTLGGAFLLQVHPHLRVGGSATALLRTAAGGVLPTGEAGELQMAYGGVVGEVDLPLHGVALSLLAGGGHATLSDPEVGTRVDADSFVVLEPAIVVALSPAPFVSLTAKGAYRWMDGVGGLPGVGPATFRSPVLSIGVRLRP